MILSAANAGGSSTATLPLTILQSLPVITSPRTASVIVSTPFTYQITATNNPLSYSAVGLPTGLAINSTTGLISGTPTVQAYYTVTIGAANATGTA